MEKAIKLYMRISRNSRHAKKTGVTACFEKNIKLYYGKINRVTQPVHKKATKLSKDRHRKSKNEFLVSFSFGVFCSIQSRWFCFFVERNIISCYNAIVVLPIPDNGRRCLNGYFCHVSCDCRSWCGLPPHQQRVR